ncbi:MAG: large subunit ribosomal protein L35Ae [Patescibacteria group bacterium]|jgi:large subunit ribosomal protein L35Ae
MVTGTVIQFRRGRKTFKPRHFLLEVEGVDSRDSAATLVGSTVSWTSPGKVPKLISGKISSAHGNNGVLRAIFESGLPGQAIGTDVEIDGTVGKVEAKKVKVVAEEKPKKAEKKEVVEVKEVKLEEVKSGAEDTTDVPLSETDDSAEPDQGKEKSE